tara:strand:+ start:214 stop:1053 length:840 start_codon:yes stop_codon:yes gene_type:complete
MNNQDFKKLLRENIEVRKEKELKEFIFTGLEKVIGKAIDKVSDLAAKEDSKNIENPDRLKHEISKKIHVLRKVIKEEIKKQIDSFNENINNEDEKIEKTEKEINYISQVIALDVYETIEQKPATSGEEIQISVKNDVSRWLEIPIEDESEEENEKKNVEDDIKADKLNTIDKEKNNFNSNTLKNNFKDFVKEIGLEYPKMKTIIVDKIEEMSKKGGSTTNPFYKENIKLYKAIGTRILSQLEELYNSFNLQVENKRSVNLDKNTLIFMEGIMKKYENNK